MRDHHGISIREESLANKLYKLMKFQAQVIAANPLDPDGEEVLKDMFNIYIHIICCRQHVIPRSVRRHTVISNLSEFGTAEDYRFRSRSDIHRLFDCLRFPMQVGPFDNGGYLDGQTAFLYFLRRSSSTCRVSDLMKEFGGDKSLWSRAFKWCVKFIEREFEHILDDFHPEFVKRFPKYADAIKTEVNRLLRDKGAAQLFTTFDVIAFIDNKCTATCRPGSGPAHDGPGAPRKDPGGLIQISVYSGWKKLHGFKIETVTAPDGMTIHALNGISMRHNDLFSLALSGVNDHLREACTTNGVLDPRQFKLYGDSIYLVLSNLLRRHNAPQLHPQKIQLDFEDKALSSVREIVEWDYQEGDLLFPLSIYKSKLKLLNVPFREIFFSRVWLHNCYVALYGSKISKRFGLTPMSLEELCGLL